MIIIWDAGWTPSRKDERANKLAETKKRKIVIGAKLERIVYTEKVRKLFAICSKKDMATLKGSSNVVIELLQVLDFSFKVFGFANCLFKLVLEFEFNCQLDCWWEGFQLKVTVYYFPLFVLQLDTSSMQLFDVLFKFIGITLLFQ